MCGATNTEQHAAPWNHEGATCVTEPRTHCVRHGVVALELGEEALARCDVPGELACPHQGL
eukprot:8418858-Lingulodinium_polyedra.AAC.1